MKYISMFSGIEAASVAWEQLGWEPVAFAEIGEFPSAVLSHHWPQVPNLGDITKVNWEEYRGKADVVVGGSPCQAFSIAGLRKGMDDDRGQLAIEFWRAVSAIQPRWVVWENVPGAINSSDGRDFGAIVGTLSELGYSFCGRVINAASLGIPQKRRRIYIVGHLGTDWRPPAAVLFEPHSMFGDSSPTQESGKENSSGVGEGIAEDNSREPMIFNWQTGGDCRLGFSDKANALHCGQTPAVLCQDDTGETVARKITPEESEALQGFPKGHTKIPYRGKSADMCPMGPRYKAIHNSMAVPVMHWIGRRISAWQSVSVGE